MWCGAAGSAKLEVLDSDDRALRTMEATVTRGIHTFVWDLLLDPALALPAEAERVAAEEAEKSEEEERPVQGRLARTPWAESVRLEHPVYATPGEYRLRVTIDEDSDSTPFEVDAPKKLEPRAKKKMKIRGEDDE